MFPVGKKRHRQPKKFTFNCTRSSQMILGLKYIYKSRKKNHTTEGGKKNEVQNVALNST